MRDDRFAPKCNTCNYWEADTKEDKYGLCKRHAPRPLVLRQEHPQGDDSRYEPISEAIVWPLTGRLDSCGEHEQD